jgi:MFS family permease
METMSTLSVSATASAVDRRLRAAGVQPETAIAFMGCLIILTADAQGLSLIPLISNLEKTYALSPTQASWALSAPALVGAGFVPTLARLGDRFGMRRLILISLLVGVLANLLCAVAPSFALLVIARALLGVSAALPLIYAVLRARGTSERRTTRGVALITLAAGVGVAVAGPVISRFGPRLVMTIGSVIMTANFVVLAYAHSGIWHFIVWDAIWGLVFAFVYSAANSAYLQDATPPEAAMYVSANTIILTAAAGIGPALFTSILTSRTIPHTPIPDPVVFKYMWLYAAAACAVMAVIALLVRRPRYLPSGVPGGTVEAAGNIQATPPGRATA